MQLPLTLQILRTLKRGRQQLSHEALMHLSAYVSSQRSGGETYSNRAGQPDLYYTLFGWMLTYVLHLTSDTRQRAAMLARVETDRLDAMHQTVFSLCRQMHRIMQSGMLGWRPSVERQFVQFLATYRQHGSGEGINAWAVQLSHRYDAETLRQVLSLQHPTGGFLSHAHAPMPDLLSTAVALFVLSLHHVTPSIDATAFIHAHWLPDGGFAPTLLDARSDVEYVFYGLLAIGAKGR